MKFLLIEDESSLAEEIVNFICAENYLVETASTYNAAYQKIHLYEYDLAIIDITLPGGTGWSLVEHLRLRSPETGIIIITAKNSVSDKIQGLQLGADDYLTKPFHLAELNARIQSILRRRKFSGDNKIVAGPIRIVIEKREVYLHDVLIPLTRKEYDLLLYCITNQERVLSKESIAEHIWGDHADAFDSLDFVYSQIKNLRKKLLAAGGPDCIKAVYGIGYKFSLV
ncbi:MAG: response regulator transcription factor [Ignavibacteria bacterium]|nr:response regulator transcription factor [Ignavibacteria bacterium]